MRARMQVRTASPQMRLFLLLPGTFYWTIGTACSLRFQQALVRLLQIKTREAKTSSFLFMGDLGVPPSCPTRACVVVVRSCIRTPSRKRLRESLRQQIPCRVVCCHRADAATDADADADTGGHRCYALTNRRPAVQSTCTCRPS